MRLVASVTEIDNGHFIKGGRTTAVIRCRLWQIHDDTTNNGPLSITDSFDPRIWQPPFNSDQAANPESALVCGPISHIIPASPYDKSGKTTIVVQATIPILASKKFLPGTSLARNLRVDLPVAMIGALSITAPQPHEEEFAIAIEVVATYQLNMESETPDYGYWKEYAGTPPPKFDPSILPITNRLVVFDVMTNLETTSDSIAF